MNDNCEFSKYAGNFLSNPNTAINTKNIPVQSGFKVVINNQNINTNSNNVNINNNILVINKFAQQKSINKSFNETEKSGNPNFDIEDLNSPKKRKYRKGNEINRHQKNQFHVTFLDKISKKRLADIVDIESYKEYNITEDLPSNSSKKNACCIII